MNGKKYITVAFLTVLFAGMANSGFAQEVVVENNTPVGARAVGMGGTGIAGANDLTALFYNPAALARIDRLEVQFGLNMLRRSIDTGQKSSIGTEHAEANTDYSGLGTIGVAYPVPTDRGSLVLGIAYNRVKDFSGTIQIDGYNDYLVGQQTGESIEEGGIGILSFGGAVDVSPNVSVGASIDIWLGDYKRDNRSLLNDDTAPYSQLDITGSDDEISAWSFKPSILYFTDKFRFGAYARLPMTFHIEESYYSEGYSRDDGDYFGLYEFIDPTSQHTDDDVTYTDNLNYKVKAPMQIGLGFAWGTPGKKSMAVDVIYENWTQAKLRYPADYLPEPSYFRDKYRSALNWKVGAEHELPFFDVVGRIGYMREPILFKGPRGYESNEPLISVENERDFITFGLGKEFDRSLRVNVGYAHGIWTQKETPREEEENRNSVFFSVIYNMQTGE